MLDRIIQTTKEIATDIIPNNIYPNCNYFVPDSLDIMAQQTKYN